MSDPTNPPPDDDGWGGPAGEEWREPQQPEPTEPVPTESPSTGGQAPPSNPPPPPRSPQPQQFYGGQHAPVPPPHPGAPPPNVPNYLVLSIISTVLCCPPFGIAGIIYASQVNSKLASGDLEGARRASGKARLWSLIGLAAGVIFWIYIAIYSVATSNG